MEKFQKNITDKNIELTKNSSELQKRIEKEWKLVITDPTTVERYKSTAYPIEQLYLSAPHDEFSLRLRRSTTEAGPTFTATIKDRGEVVGSLLQRVEGETPITEEAFAYYQRDPSVVRLHKLRAEPTPGITIDYFEGDMAPLMEVEGKDPAGLLENFARTGNMDIIRSARNETESHHATNEAIAYRLSGQERIEAPENVEAFMQRVVEEMVARYVTGKNTVIVGLSGMSGSGKSTIAEGIRKEIETLYGKEFSPIIVSTDDYHRGKQWLEKTYGAPWTNWDDARVYNTPELAADLALYQQGVPLQKRHFDFASEERVYDGELPKSPFVIVEGLFAGSEDLETVRDAHFNIPVGNATAIGRDVRRLVIENRANAAFPTPEARLRYQIETALPTYLEHSRPGGINSFSASSRPLAARAFMLERLTAQS